MAHVRAIRVLERSYITGTGDIILAGAVAGYLPFSDQLTAGDTVDYAIERTVNGLPVNEFEFGVATFQTGPTRLVRTAPQVEGGSAGPGVLVSFTAGPKKVASVVFPQAASGSTTQRFPFKKHDGSTGDIDLTGDTELPFFNAAGASKPIPLTT